MRPLWRCAPALAAMTFVAAGCSALVDLDGLAGGADAAAPAVESGAAQDSGPLPTGDASTAPDSAIALDGALPDAPGDQHLGPNLLTDGTFESGCTWKAFQGTIVSDGTARTGSGSCRVCTAAGTTDYFTGGDNFTAPPPVLGATYHGSLWVRTAPGAATPPGTILFLRTSNFDPFTTIEQNNTPGTLALTSSWQKMEITLKANTAAQHMDLYVGSDTAPGACFLVDDVWLEKVP